MGDATASNTRMRTVFLALAVVALIASIVTVGTGSGAQLGAQAATVSDLTCFASASATTDADAALITIASPLDAPAASVVVDPAAASDDTATADADDVAEDAPVPAEVFEALAVRAHPSAPETFDLWAWSATSGLVTVDPSTGGATDAAFDAPAGAAPVVVGMTFQADADPDPANDLLWIAYTANATEAPANSLIAYALDGTVAREPITVTFGDFDALTALAWDQTTGVLYGLVTASAADGDAPAPTHLISIDPATGAATGIGTTGPALQGLAVTPDGQLVAVSAAPGATDGADQPVGHDLHSLDKSTALATVLVDLDEALGATGLAGLDCVDPRPLPANPGIVAAEIIDECVAGAGRVAASLTLTGGEAPVDWIVSLTGRTDLTGTLAATNPDDLAAFDGLGNGTVTATVTNVATGAVLAARHVTVDCAVDQPSDFTVSVTTQCVAGDGTVVVSLARSTGSAPLDWSVQIGTATETGTLGPDIPLATVSADGLSDSPYAVSVIDTATSETLSSETAVVACEGAPVPTAGISANILSDCVAEDGRIVVTVSLPADAAEAGWTVSAGPVTESGTLTAAAPTATVTSSGLADGLYAVAVANAAGESVEQQSLEVSCDVDTAEVLAAQLLDECVANQGRVQASISYVSGNDPVSWSVTSNGVLVQSGTSSPDDPLALVVIAGLANGQTFDIVVSDTSSTAAAATVLASEQVAPDCAPEAQPGELSAVVTSTCAASGGQLNVSLSYVKGTEPVEWKVAVSNGFTRVGTLSTAVPSSVASAPGLADNTYSVTVTDEVTGAVIAVGEQAIACALAIPAQISAAASADPECVNGAGTIQVRVDHTSGTEAGQYKVSVSGQQPVTGSVLAGESAVSSIDGLAESAYTVAVTDLGSGAVVSNEILNVSCLAKQAASYDGDIAADCVDSAGRVTFTVNYIAGTGDAVFSLILGGATVETLTLTEPGTNSFTSTGLADGTYSIEIRANGTTIEEQVETITCAGAAISVAMSTNGDPADAEPGVQVETGSQIIWTYDVTNDGSVALSGVTVTDSELGTVTCPQTTLAPGETMSCSSMGTAVTGQYSATATAEGQVAGASPVSATDTSYYFASQTLLTIQKQTNGFDAEQAPGQVVAVGSTVNWTFLVSNAGAVDFSNVTVTDNRIAAADITCPSTTLAAGEDMTCTATGVAVAGQHTNTATVVATPANGSNVVATDVSNYFGQAVSLTVEKQVNGDDADDIATQPSVAAGTALTFTYVVTNSGNTELTSVGITDSVEGAVPCPKTTLAAGEVMMCTVTDTAEPGQQTSTATATGTGPEGVAVTNADSANYLGSGAAVTLAKLTNGQATGVSIAVGASVEWSYTVTNSGDVELTAIAVTDNPEGAVSCPQTTLAVGADMTCTLSGTAVAGTYTNSATVTATGAGATVTDTATSGYSGVTGSIGDRVFFDVNGNCADDAGEPGVADVTVELWLDADADGSPDGTTATATTKTAANGSYVFTGVADGTNYIVKFVSAANSITCKGQNGAGSQADPATGLTDTFTLPAGGTVLTVDAGLAPATIGDRVWEDTNANGVQESGELGVAGVTVKLWTDDDANGTPDTEIDSTTTNTDGEYSFTGVNPAVDNIVQFVATDRVFTTTSATNNQALDSNANTQGVTAVIPVAYGQNISDIDAGVLIASAATIGDRIFLDADEDCVADPGEELDDVKVTLLNSSSVQVAETKSDSDGKYSFAGLAAGNYKVRVDDSNTLFLLTCTAETTGLPGSPDADPTVNQTLAAGDNKTDIDFGFVTCAKIGDRVWSDVDGDGIQDTGESGAGGVELKAFTVTSSGALDKEVATATSNGFGIYSFGCLDPREDYKIQVKGAQLTKANVGSDDTIDSDISPTSGLSAIIELDQAENYVRLDIGIAEGDAEVDIEKFTNDVQADRTSTARDLVIGGDITWTYRIKNTGDVVLVDIKVTDDQEGDVSCDFDTLNPGQTKDCTVKGKVEEGLYANVGKVVATPKDGGMMVSDEDKSHYTGVSANATATPTPTTTTTGTPTVTATATTTTNNNDLAVTGANSGDMALVAIGAIALGLGLVVLGRRRDITHTS